MKRISLGLAAVALLIGGEALAVVGRPLTPVSVAGVARRTTRRSVYAGAAYGGAPYAGAAYAGAAVATTAAVAALPAGCAPLGGIYQCGGAYYRPAYQGPNVVYVVTSPP